MQISNCVRKTLMCQVSTEQWILFLCHQYGVSNRDFVHLRVSFKKKQKEYNGRNLVNFLWENPHFCISVKVLLRWLSMHKFRQICTYTSCVKCKPFVCLWNMSNEDFFFLPSVLDVIYELTMFLNNEHPFSVLRKMKNLSLPPPPSSFLFCWTSREL